MNTMLRLIAFVSLRIVARRYLSPAFAIVACLFLTQCATMAEKAVDFGIKHCVGPFKYDDATGKKSRNCK